MSRLFAGSLVVFLVFGVHKSSAIDQNLLDEAMKRYKEQSKSARDAFVRNIEATCQKINGSRDYKPVEKTEKINRLNKEKDAFKESGTLPQSEELMKPLYDYGKAINDAQKPIMKIFDTAIKDALARRDSKEAERLAKQKQSIDEQISDREKFAKVENWTGTRFSANGSGIPFDVHFETIKDNLLAGLIIQSSGNTKEEMKFEGSITGNRLELITTQIIKGGHRKLFFQGYVFDNLIILDVGVIGKGTGGGYVVLKPK